MKKLMVLLAIVAMIVPPVGLRAVTEYRTFVITEGSLMISVDGDSFLAGNAPFSTTNKIFELADPANKLLMPLFDFGKLIGGSMVYNAQGRGITLKLCDKTIIMQYGISQMTLDDKTVSVPIGLVVESGRAAISPKVICDLLGYPVEYDEKTKSLTFKLPPCPIKAEENSIVNVFAKVVKTDVQAGKMLVGSFKGELFEVSTKEIKEQFAVGDIVHAYMQSCADGSFIPYLFEKINVGFGGSIVKIYNNSKNFELNRMSCKSVFENKIIDGVPYVSIDTFASVLSSSILPGDLGKGQLTVNSSKFKISFFFESKEIELTNVANGQVQTIEMANPSKLVNGIIYVPVSALTLCYPGTMTQSQDDESISIVLEKARYDYKPGGTIATVDSVNCPQKQATFILADGSKAQATVLPQTGNQDCTSLKVGKSYQVVFDTIVTNDGSIKRFATAWNQMATNQGSQANPSIITGTVEAVLESSKIIVKVDGKDNENVTFTCNSSKLKPGFRIKALVTKVGCSDSDLISDFVVLDGETSKPRKDYSLLVSKDEGGVWIGKDDSGKTYTLEFVKTPWDLNKYIESGSKYIICGFENTTGVIKVADFLKSEQSVLSENKLSYGNDEKKAGVYFMAFKYNGKTYVNSAIILKSYLSQGNNQLSYADNQMNIATINIGSKKAVYMGKEVELSNYPIILGYSFFVYIETSDAARISETTFQETEDGQSVIFRRPDSRRVLTNDFVVNATIESVDKENQTMLATDEFGRKVRLLFMEKDSMAGLEIGKCYSLACKNHDWNDFIVFKSLGVSEPSDLRQRKVVIGSIESVDCNAQSIKIKGSDGKLVECMLKKDDNDCSLLKSGQSVVAEVFENEPGSCDLIKKWHYNTVPVVITRHFNLVQDEPIKDADTGKAINPKAKVIVVDGQYYVDLYGLSCMFSNVMISNKPNSNRLKLTIWGNVVIFWKDKDVYAINGKLKKLATPIKGNNSGFMIPVNILVELSGGSVKDGIDAGSKIADVPVCPIPVQYSGIQGKTQFSVKQVDGFDITLEKPGTILKLMVSDLRHLEGIKAGVCLKIDTLYYAFGSVYGDQIFSDNFKIVECKQP